MSVFKETKVPKVFGENQAALTDRPAQRLLLPVLFSNCVAQSTADYPIIGRVALTKSSLRTYRDILHLCGNSLRLTERARENLEEAGFPLCYRVADVPPSCHSAVSIKSREQSAAS